MADVRVLTKLDRRNPELTLSSLRLCVRLHIARHHTRAVRTSRASSGQQLLDADAKWRLSG